MTKLFETKKEANEYIRNLEKDGYECIGGNLVDENYLSEIYAPKNSDSWDNGIEVIFPIDEE